MYDQSTVYCHRGKTLYGVRQSPLTPQLTGNFRIVTITSCASANVATEVKATWVFNGSQRDVQQHTALLRDMADYAERGHLQSCILYCPAQNNKWPNIINLNNPYTIRMIMVFLDQHFSNLLLINYCIIQMTLSELLSYTPLSSFVVSLVIGSKAFVLISALIKIVVFGIVWTRINYFLVLGVW